MTAPSVLSIHSLQRGLQVLAALQDGADAGHTLAALHGATAIPKASLLRILKTLAAAGLVLRDAAGCYRAVAQTAVPAAVPRVGRDRPVGWLTPAQQCLDALATILPWPSDLAVRDGLVMRVVASNRARYARGDRRWRRSVLGAQVDLLDSALGRAWLAGQPRAMVATLLADVYALYPARARRREATLQQIERVRTVGYGCRDALYPGPDSHGDERFSSIAVPVLRNGVAVASMSCVWDLAAADTAAIVGTCLAHLVRAAAELGLTPGFVPAGQDARTAVLTPAATGRSGVRG